MTSGHGQVMGPHEITPFLPPQRHGMLTNQKVGKLVSKWWVHTTTLKGDTHLIVDGLF